MHFSNVTACLKFLQHSRDTKGCAWFKVTLLQLYKCTCLDTGHANIVAFAENSELLILQAKYYCLANVPPTEELNRLDSWQDV